MLNDQPPFSKDLTMSEDSNASVLEVRTYFVRGRNALVARADFEPLYIDYYLHRADNGLQYTNEQDAMLKDALAGLTLHLASRPQDENCGWTMNFQKPAINLFVTGNTRPGQIAGRVFTEDVRDMGANIFSAQTTRPGHTAQQSLVQVEGNQIFSCVEQYYQQSEQRIARFFRHSEEDIAMISSQPDCDEAWLASLTEDDVRAIDQKETLSLLETRRYIWKCGCTVERLYPILAKLSPEALKEAFGDDEIMTVQCPRCGARYRTAREQFEAWQAKAS
jgi:molecular chaperone Hsp33